MAKKDLLSKLMYYTGMLVLAGKISRLFREEVRILAYHRILNMDNKEEFRFDRNLISASTEQFDRQIRFVSRHYHPITFNDLIDSLNGIKKLPANPVIVSFDDGFDDNYRNAFPILKKYSVPATIFLATNYIGKPMTFWFDRVVYNLRNAEELDLSSYKGPNIRNFAQDPEKNITTVLKFLKKIPDSQRIEILDTIENRYGDEYPEHGFKDSRPMTWDQVREMANSGIEFGSHTLSHPILSKLDDRQLESELSDSRRIIEDQINQSCQVIAYPVGGREEYDQRTREGARKAGYSLGISYQTGTNIVGAMENYDIRRLHVETYIDHPRFAAMLSLPGVFG